MLTIAERLLPNVPQCGPAGKCGVVQRMALAEAAITNPLDMLWDLNFDELRTPIESIFSNAIQCVAPAYCPDLHLSTTSQLSSHCSLSLPVTVYFINPE